MSKQSVHSVAKPSLVHTVFEGLAALNARSDELRYFSLGEINLAKVRDVYLWWLPSRLRRQWAEVIVHGLMAVRFWKWRSVKGVVLLEFFAAYGWLFYPLMWLYPKRFFVFILWDQEFARQGGYRRFALEGFKVFQRMSRCVAVQMEVDDACLPSALRLPRDRTVVVPMPARDDLRPRLPPGTKPSAGKVTLGVVGAVRRDKRHVDHVFTDALRSAKQLLEERGAEVEVVIGVPMNRAGYESVMTAKDFARIIDTSTEEAYEECLSSIDILVCAFDERGYLYRSSGVITDAICSGAWVVCPDFPVLRHQITWPVSTGVTYKLLDEIPSAVERAWRMHLDSGSDSHWRWITERSAEVVDRLLQQSLAVNEPSTISKQGEYL